MANQSSSNQEFLGDIEKAIHFYEMALAIIPTASAERANALNNLGNTYLNKFSRTELLTDVEQAIRAYQSVLLIASNVRGLHSVLNNLGICYGVKYTHTGNIEDLNNAMNSLEQALHQLPPKTIARSNILNNLGTCLNLRYHQTALPGDLSKALHYYGMALDLTLPHSIERADILNNLGTSYRSRYASGQNYYSPDSKISSIVLTNKPLTPTFLSNVVTLYLNAVASIQHVIDEINGRDKRDVLIKAISQNSPINVNLEGAAETLQQINDLVAPWRRKHSEKMSVLLEREKQAEIGVRKAEISEKRALAAKGQAEAKKIAAEAAKQHVETEKLRLENDKSRLELHRAKIQLALDVLAQISPNLSESEKIAYVVRLLPPLDVLLSSELELETKR